MDSAQAYAKVKAVLAQYELKFEETEPFSGSSTASFFWLYPEDEHLSMTIDVKTDGSIRLMLVLSQLMPSVDKESLAVALSGYEDLCDFDEPIWPDPLRLVGLPLTISGEEMERAFPIFLDFVCDFVDFLASGALDEYLLA